MQSSGNLPKEKSVADQAETFVHEKANQLTKDLNGQLKLFDEKLKYHRLRAQVLTILISILGVTITVLLGLQSSGITLQLNLTIVALILSGTITVLHALDNLGNYKTLWLRYANTYNQLYAVKSRLDYLLSGPTTVSEVDNLYEKFSGILADTNEAWQEARQDKETNRQ